MSGASVPSRGAARAQVFRRKGLSRTLLRRVGLVLFFARLPAGTGGSVGVWFPAGERDDVRHGRGREGRRRNVCDSGRVRELIADSARAMERLSLVSDGIAAACGLVTAALRDGHKILTVGNGGSAAEALHMAEELVGRFRADRRPLPAVCLVADPTALTCIANDFGFDRVFSRQVEALGRPGDVLVLFSTSGRAENLALALEAAGKAGMRTLCLLGRGGGPLAGRGDREVIVPEQTVERIQEAHQVILHIVLDAVEAVFHA